ncbi:MAG TPA: lysylphosphatidylglycerol synthase domain-containing protein [Acidimicrobiia bacterium]
MTWVRDTDERARRRPADIALLVVSAILALLVGFWAQTQSSVNVNLFRTLNDLSGNMVGLAKGVYALGSIWAVLVVTAVLLVLRQFRVALYAAIAGAGALGLSLLLNEALGTHTISGLDVAVRIGDGPAYPVANVAAITALAFGIAPFIVRPFRRILTIVILLVCTAAMYLGAGFPADVLGGLLVGFGIAALVRVLLGAPGGQPSVAEVRVALTDLGYDVVDIAPATEQIQRAAVMDVVLATGEHLRVDAFGRDQRDARIAAKVWHKAMYHDPGVPVFGSRVQQVEHIAFTLMLAERALVPAARLVRTGVGGADAAVLVTMPPRGTPIGSLPVERVTDAVLRDAWKQLDALHHAGVAHGNIDGLRVVVDDDGTVAFDDFSSSDAVGEAYWRDRDDAALLVLTADLVSDERAIAAMVDALGKERAGAVIPVVQPAALPATLTKGVKHQSKGLKALRAALTTATGVDDVPPLKIKRLSLLNIGMLIGILFALTIAFHSMEGINWASVKGEFENATWAWAFLALVMYPLVPSSWATALMGCVNKDLPFVPTVLTQLACSFLNLITPNGIGGTALQIDYLHKQDVPVASAGSAMVLSTGVGGAIQMILFLTAAAITATAVDTGSSSSSSSNTLLIIALVAALIGVVLFIPKIKNKVVPAVKRAASDIWAVVRNPKKALQLVGGDTAGNLIYPLILGVCMLAFNQHLDFAQLIVVQVGAGMVGNVAPVPGGIGVTEAALTAGLTSFGIPPAPALASVLLFRGITFLIPPIFGFFTLRWLRAKGYA